MCKMSINVEEHTDEHFDDSSSVKFFKGILKTKEIFLTKKLRI